jgi:3-hydroxyacyl-CoA dehydrogenase
MIKQIRKVAVLGAGVMGSGIAAHLANAGIPSLLLDMVPRNPQEGEDTSSKAFRNKYAASAIQKLKKSRPPALFTKRDLALIEVGNFDDDLHRVSECDWIVEVVIENLAIKQSLFAKIEEHRRPGTLITSNTSGLSIEGMQEGRSDDFRRHFLVTHFFNPVRYMKLLELVPGSDTDPAAMALLARFGEEVIGKGIVYGKDTTNFIANRIGVYGMMKTMQAMQSGGYSVEEVDKVFGPATGRPKSAVFRTADLVGLDTFAHVSKNCYDTLPDDEERDIFQLPAFAQQMIEKGWLGGKSGQGFYKKSKGADGKRVILSLDLDTLEYTEQAKVRYASLGAAKKEKDVRARIKKVVYFEGEDRGAALAREVIFASLAYSARRLGEIADDVVNIDRGMRWGFNWDLGPFETWDALGVKETIAQMTKDGLTVADWVVEMVETGHETFYGVREDGEPTFYDVKTKAYQPVPRSEKDVSLGYLKQTKAAGKVASNLSASLWDIGDGVLGLEFHSALNAKMNPIDDDIIIMMEKAVEEVEANYEGLVIGHDGDTYSAGANLLLLLMHANQSNWDGIAEIVTRFQAANQAMRYCNKPVVAAPAGLALGGGAEVVLGANAV